MTIYSYYRWNREIEKENALLDLLGSVMMGLCLLTLVLPTLFILLALMS